MARTAKPDSIYRVSLHRNGVYRYAATHPFTVDADGRRRYRIIHWGTVTEDLKFIPGKRYLEASPEKRGRLIFPEGWDLSSADATDAARVETEGSRAMPCPLPYTDADSGKAYGDVWLLERLVNRYGVREDLCEVLGDATCADDILTLAYYPFLSGTSFLRFPRWQATTKIPSGHPLDEMVAESLAKVSRIVLHRFMDLRRKRHEGERMCAVDSVVRHSSGEAVSDRKWGQKTERIHFQSTVEAVAYSLDSHVPVIYSSFPEVVTDARGMGVFRSELAKAGLGGIMVVTDRGYDSIQGLERYFHEGPMVMCVDVKQPAVLERIRSFGRFREHPAGMRYDAASRRWYRQYLLSSLPDLRLNLFFNPERRAAELAQIDSEIASQHNALRELADYAIAIDDRRALRRDQYFFKTSYDADTGTVTAFTPDKSRILSTRAASGFYANVTSGLDTTPLEAVAIYGLKYDQEKFLRQFRSLLDFPRRPLHTEHISFGIQILQYIGLLLNTTLRHSLMHPEHNPESNGENVSIPFRSVTEALDELHNVHCRDAGDGTCALATLTSLQQRVIDILLPTQKDAHGKR